MCLNCGCGEFSDNHGDPLNITRSRLALIASRNHSTMKVQAMNILATLLGFITEEKPLKQDLINIAVHRIAVKPEMKTEYVKRTRTKGPEKPS